MKHSRVHLVVLFGISIMLFLFVGNTYTQAACQFHNITGYVWSRNSGWVSLNCNAGGSIDYGLDIDFESGETTEPVTGYAWSANMGWLNMQPSGPFPSAPSHASQFNRNTGGSPTTTAGTLTGWAQWEALGDDGWMQVGPLTIDSTDYGVGITADRLFTGWSWNAGTTLPGDGWVYWDSVGSGGGASVLQEWFETLYGDIYSGGNIQAPFSPPSSRYNATYLIQADGTIQPVVISSQGGASSPYLESDFDTFTLPDVDNDYEGTLGLIDKAGMLSGRYGTVTSWPSPVGSLLLDGTVYQYTGDLTISSALSFTIGSGTQKGNGTIVVTGDLNINADVTYQSGAVNTRIDNLPSVAWIVGGDITFGSGVTEAVGVFYSEGATGISTGTTGSALSDVALIIKGMLIAKDINLERLYVDASNEPAEQFIFDGRAIVNPPPGLVDLAKGLPTLREIRP